MQNELNELKTSSPVAFKEILLHDVAITTATALGAYYGGINNFFANNGINYQKVIAITILSWSNVASLFNVYTNGSDFDRLGFMSSVSQTIGDVKVRIAYLK